MSELFDFGYGVFLEILALIGLVATCFTSFCLIYYKETKKNPHMIFVLNVMVCDLGHLSIVAFHIVPEMIGGNIAWGDFDTFITDCHILFWYGTLVSLILVAGSRLIAVRFPAKLKIWLTIKIVVIMILTGWIICIAFALTPLLDIVCCLKIFDLHAANAKIELQAEEDTNYLRILTHVLNAVVVTWTIFCYFHVIKVMLKTKNSSVGLSVSSGEEYGRRIGKIRRLTIQFTGIICLFLAVWIAILIHDVFIHNAITEAVARLFYTLNSALTPFIVCSTSSNLQREVKRLMKKYCCHCRKNTVLPISAQYITPIHGTIVCPT